MAGTGAPAPAGIVKNWVVSSRTGVPLASTLVAKPPSGGASVTHGAGPAIVANGHGVSGTAWSATVITGAPPIITVGAVAGRNWNVPPWLHMTCALALRMNGICGEASAAAARVNSLRAGRSPPVGPRPPAPAPGFLVARRDGVAIYARGPLRVPGGACERRAPGGAGERRAPGGACQRRAPGESSIGVSGRLRGGPKCFDLVLLQQPAQSPLLELRRLGGGDAEFGAGLAHRERLVSG